jgi:hypothetical protein
LNDFHAQSILPFGRPAYEVVLHQCAHLCFLSKLAPEQKFIESVQNGKLTQKSIGQQFSPEPIIYGYLNIR